MTDKIKTIGTRAQVWHGTAKRTPGGLTKKDLMKNRQGRIVSMAKHNSAKKEMRLLKYGYGTKKGHFGFVKMGSKSRKMGSKSRKMRGGSGNSPLTPSDVGGSYMIPDVVPQSFSPLDRALVGGRRHKHKGGTAYGGVFQPADVGATAVGGLMADNQNNVIGLTDYPGAGADSVQFAAGQSGGRSKSRGRGMSMYGGKNRSRGMSMYGGTTKPSLMGPMGNILPKGIVMPSSPMGRALGSG